MILIFMVEGARAVISFCILSAMPGYMVDAAGLHAEEAGLEDGLGTPEPLVADGDHLGRKNNIVAM
jgi:cytochrome c biogenesis protein CcdA